MEEIEIKITIPIEEYKDWWQFDKGGSEFVKQELKGDFINMIRNIGCHKYDIELKIVK